MRAILSAFGRALLVNTVTIVVLVASLSAVYFAGALNRTVDPSMHKHVERLEWQTCEEAGTCP